MKKRVLAILLSMLMLVSLFPMTTLATSPKIHYSDNIPVIDTTGIKTLLPSYSTYTFHCQTTIPADSNVENIKANGLAHVTQVFGEHIRDNRTVAGNIGDEFMMIERRSRGTEPATLWKVFVFFLGWNTKPDGTGTTYAPGDKNIEFTTDTTLYAMWGAKYTVNYYSLISGETGSRKELGSAVLTGMINSPITVSAGSAKGELDAFKPKAAAPSGKQVKNANVSFDGKSTVEVEYKTGFVLRYAISGECEEWGEVTGSDETFVLNGETPSVVGAKAEAKPGCRFVKWMNKDTNETVSTDPVFVPKEPEGGWEGASFVAVFEPCKIEYSLDMPNGLSYGFDIPKVGNASVTITGTGLAFNGLGDLCQKTMLPGEKPATIYGSSGQPLAALTAARQVVDVYFLGWSTEPDGRGTIFSVGERPTFEEEVTTLYAVWSTKKMNRGTIAGPGQAVDEGAEKEEPTSPSTGDSGALLLMMLLAALFIAGFGFSFYSMKTKQ